MTFAELKNKLDIKEATFYSQVTKDGKETNWSKAYIQEKDIELLIRKSQLKRLLKYRDREDVSIESSIRVTHGGKHLCNRYILALKGVVFSIGLLGKIQHVTIIPTLTNVRFERIDAREAEQVILEQESCNIWGDDIRDKVALEFDVLFRIAGAEWKIPYVIVLEKGFYKVGEIFINSYWKWRARLQKVETIEVTNETLYPFLLHALFLLDRTQFAPITAPEYEKSIDPGCFLFFDDIYNTNSKWPYVVKKSFYEKESDNPTNINTILLEQVSFKATKAVKQNLVTGYFYLNVFPACFTDSYLQSYRGPNGEFIHRYPNLPIHITVPPLFEKLKSSNADLDGKILFQGTYEECHIYLHNEENVQAVKNVIENNNKKTIELYKFSEIDDYYRSEAAKEDYFNAITDGQLGTYDEFLDDRGSIENIDNY